MIGDRESARSERSFLDHVSVHEDPRRSWNAVCPLDEVLLIVPCGPLAGAEDFVEIQWWALRKIDVMRRLRPSAPGIPSDETLDDVMNTSGQALRRVLLRVDGRLSDAEPDIGAIGG